MQKACIYEKYVYFCGHTHHESMKTERHTTVDVALARDLRRLGYRALTLAYYDREGLLQNADGADPVLKDHNAPSPTRTRGPRCYSAPTLTEVQEWLRQRKRHMLLVQYDSFFGGKGTYFCRIVRLKDGLSRDTRQRKTYDAALHDGIRQTAKMLL